MQSFVFRWSSLTLGRLGRMPSLCLRRMLGLVQKRLLLTRSMLPTQGTQMMWYRYVFANLFVGYHSLAYLTKFLLYTGSWAFGCRHKVRSGPWYPVWRGRCPVWHRGGHLWVWGPCGGCSPGGHKCLLQCGSGVRVWPLWGALFAKHLRGNSHSDGEMKRLNLRRIEKIMFCKLQHLTHEQPLNLVKKDRKRKPSSIDGNTDVVICKLCNSYVVSSMIEQHNRWAQLNYIHPLWMAKIILRVFEYSFLQWCTWQHGQTCVPRLWKAVHI